MMEIIITSSILILMITLLRHLLQGKISARLQYALWLLVAIRLLLPFPLFESSISVMNVAAEIQSQYPATVQPILSGAGPDQTVIPGNTQRISINDVAADEAVKTVTVSILLQGIWLCGFASSTLFFLASNIRLSRRLKQERIQIEGKDCPLPIYTVTSLPSPCLYGMLKPAIYLTTESLSSDQRTTYVLAHELTHYRQKDHIWSFVRILCLCIHWFNPLVWMAAILSRRDSELACDEGTLRQLGDENRGEYGRTLIDMVSEPSKPSHLFYAATTMTGGKKEMTERIKRIAKQPKMLKTTLVAVVVIATLSVSCTFGSAITRSQELIVSTTGQGQIVKMNKKDGEITSYSLYNKELAEAIIMDGIVKSAAWQGVDIDTLEEVYYIQQTFPEANEIHNYYAYLLTDDTAVLPYGTPVLQTSENGQYTALSPELYAQLVDSFRELNTQEDPQLRKTQSFANVTNLNITGYLQHIEVKPADGNEVVISWVSDGTETVSEKNGRAQLAFAEPNWRDKQLPNDGSPRFAVVSTITVEVPASMKTITLTSTLGDITIDSLTSYGQLTVKTINGNIAAHNIVGMVKAETSEGTIGPATFAADIIEQEYSPEQTSKHLQTTIAGAANSTQRTNLSTVLGSIVINE